ncbi:bifunctional glycosyltransferase family 2/GtrA family protein [Candidatus Dojkabacteria bacterium]|uniref:dolichyl-phosphate beta-glucosyltransferase n=1 Tax=Candidatus Dojkabacteria bacterium TaxID=2099670 RepID=A0A955L6Z8_9BACT|nr:bifunctional glycosyltransferase family 2/GtrA family protein [Candidatus Dojkabacteria bacterium]
MGISIVIPAYNESHRIGKSITKILEFISNHPDTVEEIIVVDDGSTDNTKEIVSQFSEVVVISYEHNRGKGYALKRGVEAAKGDFIYLCDADLSTPISELPKFITYASTYDCVIGSRGLRESRERNQPLRSLLGKFGNILINILLDLDITDTQCGFKLISKECKAYFSQVSTDRWGYDFEFLYIVRTKNKKIKEIPVQWDAAGGSRVGVKAYATTFIELLSVWWKYEGLSKKFIISLIKRYNVLIKYILVGTITNLSNILLFIALNKNLEINSYRIFGYQLRSYQVWDTVSFLVTIVFFNFILHKFWTFQKTSWKLGEAMRYGIVLIVNQLASLLLLTFFIDYVGMSKELSKLVSLGIIIMWNFLVLKHFVYKD